MPEDTSTPTPGPDERPESELNEQPTEQTAEQTEPSPVHDEHAASEPVGASAVPADQPAGKGNRRVVAIVAAVVVLLLVAGGAVGAVFALKNRPHKIATPATAGGMKRDQDTEKKYASQLSAIRQQITKQVGATKTTKIAVYNQTKSSRGAVGPIVFFGAELTEKHADSESPSKWIDGKLLKTFEKNKLKVLKFNLDEGGRAVCAEQTSAKTAACVWRTKDSVGELFPINPGWTAAKMSKLMKAVRADVETV